MDYSYNVSTIPSTSISFSLTCQLFSLDIINLVIIKGNYLEVYNLTENGLNQILKVLLYGTITALDKYKPGDYQFDVLFILTEKKYFTILSYDIHTNSLITRAKGSVKDQVGRNLEQGQKGIIDPDGKVIGMVLYDGLFKVFILFHFILCFLYFFDYYLIIYIITLDSSY